MKQTYFLLVTLLFLALNISKISAESVSVLLQKGIYAEETEGDLDAAMKIYRDIVQAGDSNRPLLAQAQFRLGMCHLKMGNRAEAVVVFDALLQKFPTEGEMVEKAREQLRVLGQTATDIVTQTLFSGFQPIAVGLLSPDEKKIAYVDRADPKKNDVVVKDLETGSVAKLTKVAYANSNTTEWPYFSPSISSGCWSPDSAWVAYMWRSGDRMELRISRANGSESKSIENSEKFWPIDWSPDGEHIICEFGESGLLVTLADGASVKLPELGHARFSPNGKWIVGDRENEGGWDIFAVNVQTKELIQLTDFATDETKPVFSADGSHILFSSNYLGTWDLWSMPFDEGEVAGLPTLIKTGFGDQPKRVADTGNLQSNASRPMKDVYSAEIDSGSTGLTAAPVRLTSSNFGQHSSPTWSSDGQRVAFVRGNDELCIRNMASGREETFQPDLYRLSKLDWSPTSDLILIHGNGPQDPLISGLYVWSIKDRSLRRLPTRQGRQFPLGWSADGRQFFVKYMIEPPVKVVAVDLESDVVEDVPIPEVEGHFEHVGFSPDQSRVCYTTKTAKGSQVIVLDRKTGESKALKELGPDKPGGFFAPRWSPDGSMIAISTNAGPETELLIFSPDMGWEKKIDLRNFSAAESDGPVGTDGRSWVSPVSPYSWSPDSKRIAFTLYEGTVAEVCLVKNLPSLVASNRK